LIVIRYNSYVPFILHHVLLLHFPKIVSWKLRCPCLFLFAGAADEKQLFHHSIESEHEIRFLLKYQRPAK